VCCFEEACSRTPHISPVKLSQREKQVLAFLLEGETNREIARQLRISGHTVKSHVTHIFNKLGVANRTQAAVVATRLRLVGQPDAA